MAGPMWLLNKTWKIFDIFQLLHFKLRFWQSSRSTIAHQMEQFVIPTNGQKCMRRWKCPWQARKPCCSPWSLNARETQLQKTYLQKTWLQIQKWSLLVLRISMMQRRVGWVSSWWISRAEILRWWTGLLLEIAMLAGKEFLNLFWSHGWPTWSCLCLMHLRL